MKLIIVALSFLPASLFAQPLESPEIRAAAAQLVKAAQAARPALPGPEDAVGPGEPGDVTDEEASRPPTPVNEDVWRSGRPNRVALERLYDMGIKTIVNLEGGKPYAEEKDLLRQIEAERAAQGKPARHINSIAVPMSGIAPPTFRQVDRALAVLENPSTRPALVHCKHGEDRTGVTVAAFRLEVEGRQTLDEAVTEAKSYHCCHLVLVGEHGLERFLKLYRVYRSR